MIVTNSMVGVTECKIFQFSPPEGVFNIFIVSQNGGWGGGAGHQAATVSNQTSQVEEACRDGMLCQE